MSDSITIARPYAKAIFQYALVTKALVAWSNVLRDLAEAVLDSDASSFICNPNSSATLQTQLLVSIFSKKTPKVEMKAIENLIGLLAENKRLLVLPDIFAQYEALRAEQEKTLTVCVSSFSALTNEQQEQLITSLSQRLQREVTLDISVDTSLLGGAVIRAGDLVIDGSVRGKLNKLSAELAA